MVFIYIAQLEVLYVLIVHIKTVRLSMDRIRWNGRDGAIGWFSYIYRNWRYYTF